MFQPGNFTGWGSEGVKKEVNSVISESLIHLLGSVSLFQLLSGEK